MEIALALIALVAIGAIIYVNREARSLDINNDGKVDLEDAKAAVTNTLSAAKDVADVNKDGKVDAADAKQAAAKVKDTAKKAVAKKRQFVKKAVNTAKDTAKKTTAGRKPRSKA